MFENEDIETLFRAMKVPPALGDRLHRGGRTCYAESKVCKGVQGQFGPRCAEGHDEGEVLMPGHPLLQGDGLGFKSVTMGFR